MNVFKENQRDMWISLLLLRCRYYYTSIKRNILQHEPNLHYMYSIQSNQHPVDNKGIDFPLGSLGHAPHANM